MVVIPLHILPICTHHNQGVSNVSKYGTHKAHGFLAPFAIYLAIVLLLMIADVYTFLTYTFVLVLLMLW